MAITTNKTGKTHQSAQAQATEALSQQGEQLKTVAQQILENCRGYSHKNSLVSLGLAVGDGFF